MPREQREANGHGKITYDTGAIRSDCAECVRFDLISPFALERLARTMAEGSHKYGDRNWEKGFPASTLVNHAMNHINLWLGGDATEDHLAHAAFNLFALMHFEEVLPSMIDITTRGAYGPIEQDHKSPRISD